MTPTLHRRWDSPATPMVMTVPLTVGFVVLRWMDAAHRRLGAFVLAGSRYASRSHVPKGLPVVRGSGYDGQFYYRLALNPANLSRAAYGIRFDAMSRAERIGYPFLAWALAWGSHARVPLTLIVVNIVAAAVLALAGGLLAQSAGRHALWGLVFPLYWGYLWTLGRDLSELTTAALVLLGLAALLRDRPIWAGLAFLGGILSKETAALLVGTLALTTLWLRWSGPPDAGGRRLLRWHPSDLAFVIPGAGFALWQCVLLLATGRLPIFESGGENLGPPFLGFARGISHYVALFPSVASALWFGELAVLVLLIVGVARRKGPAPRQLQVLWAVAVVLGICAATGIWLGDVGFRSLDDIYLLSWVVLLFGPRRIMQWAALCGGVWCVVAVELVRYI